MPPTRAAAARYILRSRLLRGAFISLVISGIGISVTAPQMTLFLVRELHLTDALAGLYYLTNLAAPIAGYVVGSLSDRAGSRLLVFRLSALAGFAGWVLMAFATQTWMPFAINILLLSVAGAGAAQLQAAVRDELDRHPTPVDNQVVALTRMAMAFGWIIGPVIGATLGAVLGLRPLLLATGVSLLLSIVPLIGAGRAAPVPGAALVAAAEPEPDAGLPPAPALTRTAPIPTGAPRTHSMVPLLLFTGIYVLIMCGETVKLAYLPLYMDGDLHVSAAVRGAIIGFQPLVEVALMPLAALIADRVGIARVLLAGAVMAVGAHACYASADAIEPHLLPLIAGQVLMAGVIATFGVLGVTVAQRFQPARVGMASSVFLSSYAINAAVGGFVGSIGTAWLGLPHLFWIPGAIAAAGGIALVTLNAFVPLDRLGEEVRRPAAPGRSLRRSAAPRGS
ncbi:sugar efflux transporter SetB [Leifsonia sp. LS1]|uniref:MFS transporter n=1 Tax=Leifsonia sp. LS1 TaxID=2828483 RepID=UPI001CFC72AC|nr:MFS transporter [Leifsonia sp. LS1]GIT81265.1 sugar efflux transporter SetB [Leifsonia sp. LS1]